VSVHGHYHLVGIGGVGMSALAQALLDAGATVSGSDRLLDRGDATDTLQRLAAQGVALHAQDGSGVAPGTAGLVISTAIEPDNPDLARARSLGVPVAHRAEALARLVADQRLIAVTGTCGKSTVTAMAGWMLAGCGLDPAVVNGAAVVGWDGGGRLGSVRRGAGAWAVIEADESDRSLLAFSPEHAVITNASADHFALPETLALFEQFRGRVRGTVIDGARNPEPGTRNPESGTRSPEPGTRSPEPEGLELFGWSGRFVLEGVEFAVPAPGRHNVWNAWHAARAARLTGAPAEGLAAALRTFRGVERRLQRVGARHGAAVIDDYAHNPEKLSAAWRTLSGAFPRVCAVWRPHGFGPLRNMMDALVSAFVSVCRPCDMLLLLPVYDAGGTADRSVSSGQLHARLEAAGVRCRLVADLEEAGAALEAAAAPGTALVTFGARDPGLPRLARRLAEEGPSR
jgi:UDP-N-acetylmuramate--alanine ligase